MPTVTRFPSTGQEQARDAAPVDVARLVRDALRHLHDPVYLQTHPLTRLLAEPHAMPQTTGQRLRDLLLDAIAALQPSSAPGDARASRRYELLTLRYGEALDIADVAARLAISRREYDREHRQALDAVVSLLQDGAAFSASSPRHVPAPPVAAVARSSEHLPLPLTSFIGRAQELEAVVRLIQSARLVTLTGPPGTGKTRLALQVAATLAASAGCGDAVFPDGVSFISLAALSDPGLVVPAMAQVLGVRDRPNHPLSEVLQESLADRHMLVILDNFEHVLEAAPIVSRLLAACPQLTILVTSRSSLRLSGEHDFVVPPLQVPQHDVAVPLGQVAHVEAVRLYLERAGAAHSGFRLTEQNAPAVIEICRRLDGLPLAIELAAARSRIFPPYALLGRLTGADRQGSASSLALLTGGPRDLPARQQTLRAAIDWSYRLLTPHEQRLFAQLSVFAGGWSLEAAEAICVAQGELDVLEGLASLVDKSLVRQEERPEGEPRFSMLETIREHAREQLAALGEEERLTHRRHAAYFLSLAREADANYWGHQQALWLRRLSGEFDNLRAALAWSRDNGEIEIALHLGGALFWFWHEGGYATEARDWLESALALATPAHCTAGRARALDAAGICNWNLGNVAAARAWSEESLSINRELGDRRGMGHALHGLGVMAAEQGDLARARTLIEEGLSLSQAVGDRPFVGLALHNLGLFAVREGDEETARSYIEASRRVWQELGNTPFLSMVASSLGDLARSQGAFAEATAHYRESLEMVGATGPPAWRAAALYNLGHTTYRQGHEKQARALVAEALTLCRALGDRRGMAECVAGLGCVAARTRPQRAARLLGAAMVTIEAAGPHLSRINQADYDQALMTARRRLGDDAFEAAWRQGRALTLEQAVAEAREEQPPVAP